MKKSLFFILFFVSLSPIYAMEDESGASSSTAQALIKGVDYNVGQYEWRQPAVDIKDIVRNLDKITEAEARDILSIFLLNIRIKPAPEIVCLTNPNSPPRQAPDASLAPIKVPKRLFDNLLNNGFRLPTPQEAQDLLRRSYETLDLVDEQTRSLMRFFCLPVLAEEVSSYYHMRKLIGSELFEALLKRGFELIQAPSEELDDRSGAKAWLWNLRDPKLGTTAPIFRLQSNRPTNYISDLFNPYSSLGNQLMRDKLDEGLALVRDGIVARRASSDLCLPCVSFGGSENISSQASWPYSKIMELFTMSKDALLEVTVEKHLLITYTDTEEDSESENDGSGESALQEEPKILRGVKLLLSQADFERYIREGYGLFPKIQFSEGFEHGFLYLRRRISEQREFYIDTGSSSASTSSGTAAREYEEIPVLCVGEYPQL